MHTRHRAAEAVYEGERDSEPVWPTCWVRRSYARLLERLTHVAGVAPSIWVSLSLSLLCAVVVRLLNSIFKCTYVCACIYYQPVLCTVQRSQALERRASADLVWF